MSKETIDHSTLICLAEAGAVSQLSVVAQQGGWIIMIRYGEHQRTLIAQRSGKVRVFKRFDTLAAYLKDMGINQFEVDITDYDPVGSGKGTRPDRSAALKRAHEAAAMDEATQQNAALVEEASAAARSMEEQANLLAEAVSVFRTGASVASAKA